jgi:hypothetical protein
MITASKWFMLGQPTRCAACGSRFNGVAWRRPDGRYYCDEVCGDTNAVRQEADLKAA